MRRFYLFFLVLLALSTWIHTVDAVVVAVPDRVLGGILRSKLNLAVDADITDTALRNLDELILAIPTETDFKIADLTGLEYATRLTRVILDGHSISNLEPLTSWTAITALSLTGNSIVDLEPLRNLTTLTTLHLSNNQIADVSPLAGLTNLVDLALAGNDGIVDTSPLAWLPLTTSVDVNIPPAVRINDVPTSEQSGAFNVTIEFSEVVTGFQQVDIALTGSANATVTSFSGSNKEYTATITPTTDGDITIQVPAGVAQDNNGENNIASSEYSEYTVSVDVPDVSPQVTKIRWPDFFVRLANRLEYHMLPTAVSDVSVNITFSEDVTDFEPDDIELLGTAGTATTTTIESLTGSDSEYILTIRITPSEDGTGDGTLGILIPEGAVQSDVSGNDNIEYSTDDSDIAVLFIPTLEIVVPEEPQNGSFDVKFVFNELVTGFTQGWVEGYFDSDSTMDDILGTITVWDENATGTVYTATITPTRDGVFPIFRFAAVQAPAKNTDGIKVIEQVFSSGEVRVDLTRPSVNITDVPTTANAPFEVTITFSEDVMGFAAGDISLTGSATAEVSELTGSGSDYTATITPTTSGFVIIQVLADAVEDAATNLNTASESHTVSVSVDLVRPSVVISDVPTTSQNSDFDITIMFSESVTGFRSSDISLTGTATAAATVSAFSGSGSGITYTASITPTGSGDLTIQVPANVAQGDVNNNNNTASRAHTVSVDLVHPSVSITGVPPTSQNSDFDITIMFSESVTGFQSSDISLTGTATAAATVSAFSGSGTTYTASITPTGSGDLTIRVPANVAQDDVSNNNTASRAHTVSVDLVRPSVVISDVPTTSQNSDFDITIMFSESVTGFQASGILLTGTATAAATVSAFSGSGTTYTASITPTGSGI